MIGREARAIVWAQWRSLSNYHNRSRSSRFPIAALFALIWYGFWALTAVAAGITAADPESLDLLQRSLPSALLLIFIYWQIVPIIMVSTGVSLDLSRLMVYPIPHVQLFTIEVLLRITTCIEMLLLSAGIAVGLACNPRLPVWTFFPIVVFAVFNLFVSAGLKDLLGRLMARRGFREAMVFLLVLTAALPQLLLVAGPPEGSVNWLQAAAGVGTAWGAAGRLALGYAEPVAVALLALWTAGAWLFGRNQFERVLRFDAAAAKADAGSGNLRERLIDKALQFSSRVLRDPMAVLVEKEVRFLSRSPRFRLLFLMGFSFGLLIWLPIAVNREADSFFRTNYLTVVTAYASMLLGEVCFWNNLGLDRGAVQAYFVMPVSMLNVLRAKNIAAAFFVLLELALVAGFCALLRMPVTIASISEAFAVTLVFSVFLLSMGNMLSVRYPRPIDPAQSWRSGSMGRAQAYLLLLYPVATAPILLAFGAQFAFDSVAAFYGVLLLDLAIGCVFYAISLQSSAQTAEANRESIVHSLARAEGPAAG